MVTLIWCAGGKTGSSCLTCATPARGSSGASARCASSTTSSTGRRPPACTTPPTRRSRCPGYYPASCSAWTPSAGRTAAPQPASRYIYLEIFGKKCWLLLNCLGAGWPGVRPAVLFWRGLGLLRVLPARGRRFPLWGQPGKPGSRTANTQGGTYQLGDLVAI